MIEIKNVSKRYGETLAVDDVSFNINDGEILGFLGRNGAGKSTTMNMVTGYISSDAGSIKLDGVDILENPREFKRQIGYLPEQPPLYMDMTVKDYLTFVCDIKGVLPKKQKAHLDDIVDLVKLGDVYGRLIKNLSKGYKQRVGMAQALVGNPKVVIMDEPTVGLDPRQIIEIRKLMKDLGKNHTVVLSSHILPEVADVCDRVVIINKGKIVASDLLSNLTSGINQTAHMSVRVHGAEKTIQKAIAEVPGVNYVESIGSKEPGSYDFIVESSTNVDVRRPMFNALANAACPILMLKPMEFTLEDIFMRVTAEKEDII
ncbi:MAG: ATP-binding cassette domain-containing protein [Clostridiales bacterium]|nr:ATP-binding cassette domain-containing protein [Clostridiales bacterium]MBQ2816704.1 ATP-binding cassette domain-containing protein [Clostridia bacterium]